MTRQPTQAEIAERVDQLQRIAQELYYQSEDFPALNRNLKRILASIHMLRINLEQDAD
ncbi:MAG: hypothetical protein AB1664_11035 [Thermodesulfobacteriota bacterium]